MPFYNLRGSGGIPTKLCYVKFR